MIKALAVGVIAAAPFLFGRRSAVNHFYRLIILLSAGCSAFGQGTDTSRFVPTWVQDAVFYQIFPERFANGDTLNDPPGTEPWGGTPRGNNYFGGDLKGIIDHLDYLHDLGINAIYLNPIFESSTNHKYQTKDYYKIDPHFGDEKMFSRLLQECHSRGIRVVIDGVFNHTGVDFFAFADVRKNGKDSKYATWFNIYSYPVGPPNKPNYEGWWGLGSLPKLMADTPEVRKYLFGVAEFWTRKGIDGWRLDVPNEMSHDFWISWRNLVKGINPEAYICGEIWDDASPWLKGDQFDAVMNYRFRGACVGFFALENQNAVQFDSILQVQRSEYPPQVDYALQNLIGSHDTERFLTLSGGDERRVRLAALMQMTYPGAPMIYYGDEIGMEGGRDPDCRKTMIWDSTKWNRELRSWYRKLIALRMKLPALRRGSFLTLAADSATGFYSFMRADERDTICVAINNGTSLIDRDIVMGTGTGPARELVAGVQLQRDHGILKHLKLPPMSGAIIQALYGRNNQEVKQ